jgi:1,4-dihydroxy-2-naphthoate octaprenyltransferase
MKKLKLYLKELRAPFFTGVIVPVILGSVIARYHTGRFSWFFFAATLIGAVLIHAGANVINDYYDHRSGNDDANTDFVRPFTGGSRMIPDGLLSPREVLLEGMICYGLGALIGLWLAYERGLPILFIGLIGTLTSFFYSAPPFKFVYRGIGEIFIALNFGVLTVLGAYYVQAQSLSWIPVIASIPVALLIMLVLYINEFQDYSADKLVNKNQWVVRLGRKRAAIGYALFLTITYGWVLACVLTNVFPIWSLAVLATSPLAIKAIKTARAHYDHPQQLTPANALTIQLHLVIGLMLSASYLVPWHILVSGMGVIRRY